MIILLGDRKFVIPDEVIDEHAANFEALRSWDNRANLMRIREDIAGIMFTLQEDPELLYDPEFINDLVNMLAMRQGLHKKRLLHDA